MAGTAAATARSRASDQEEASAATQATRALVAMIASGDFGPGDRLPTERELAGRLGLARSTIREAIRGLAMLGVIDVRHGGGTFVSNLDGAALLQSTAFVTELMRPELVVELLAARSILESAAAALAAARISDDGLAALRSRLENLFAAETAEDALEADVAFHGFIATEAGNRILASLVEVFSARTYRARYLMTTVNRAEATASMRGEHTAIYDAIARRDPDGARSMMATHILGVIDWVEQTLSQGSSTESIQVRPDGHLRSLKQGKVARRSVTEFSDGASRDDAPSCDPSM